MHGFMNVKFMEAVYYSEKFVRINLATGFDTQKTTAQFLMRITARL
jgi:hypothetical protein